MNAEQWLRLLAITGTAREQLLRNSKCLCGQPGVALGLFDTLSPFNQIVRNAMWLCEDCIEVIDPDVYVVRIEGGTFMRDPDALFAALVRAELKKLINGAGPPDEERWDRQRARNLPDALTIERRLKMTWEELCSEVWEPTK